MTRAEVAQLLMVVSATYPNVALNEGTTAAWYTLLGDLSFDVATNALRRVLATRMIPSIPTPGEIRREATLIMHPGIPTAAEAWRQVLNNLTAKRAGWGLTGIHSLAVRAADAIGWQAIGMSEQPDTIRAQFMRSYEAIREQELRELQIPEHLRVQALGAAQRAALPGEEKT